MAGLTIAPATGDQGTTQNPQTVPTQSVGASTQSSGVQPGTASSLLTSPNGLSLHTSALTTVSMGAASTTVQTESRPSVAPVTPATHHANPVIFGIPIILVLIAIGLSWAVTRSAKSTTD